MASNETEECIFGRLFTALVRQFFCVQFPCFVSFCWFFMFTRDLPNFEAELLFQFAYELIEFAMWQICV